MHPLMILPTGSGKTNWALAFAIACALALPRGGNPLCDALTIQDTAGRPAESSQDRRRLVDSFILRCLLETGETVTRKMIWRSAGYHSPHRNKTPAVLPVMPTAATGPLAGTR